jgi:hypothetical protein
MIEIWCWRNNGAGEILMSSRYADVDEAVVSLLKYEMGYGGKISHLSDTSLTVKTQVLACKDRTVYTGEKEEMAYLLAALKLWLEAEEKVSIDDLWKKVSEMSKGKALLVTCLTPLVKGDLIKEKLAERFIA